MFLVYLLLALLAGAMLPLQARVNPVNLWRIAGVALRRGGAALVRLF